MIICSPLILTFPGILHNLDFPSQIQTWLSRESTVKAVKKKCSFPAYQHDHRQRPGQLLDQLLLQCDWPRSSLTHARVVSYWYPRYHSAGIYCTFTVSYQKNHSRCSHTYAHSPIHTHTDAVIRKPFKQRSATNNGGGEPGNMDDSGDKPVKS